METDQIEPELLKRPPRTVKRRPMPELPPLGLGLFLGIFPLLGLGMLFWGLYQAVVQIYGQTTTAHITQWRTRGGEENSYLVDFDYTVSGKRYSATSVTRPDKYQSLPLGSAISVRYAPWAPGIAPAAPFQDAGLWMEVGMGFFFVAIGSLIFRTETYQPLRQRALAVNGVAVRGIIQSVTQENNGNVIVYRVKYQFQPDAIVGRALDAIVNEMQVPKRYWKPLSEGESATVLYWETRPTRNILYDFCLYQVIAEDETLRKPPT